MKSYMVSREDFYNFCEKKSLETGVHGYAGYANYLETGVHGYPGYAYYKTACHDGVSLIKIKRELSLRIRAFEKKLDSNRNDNLASFYLSFLNASLDMFNFLTYGEEL